MVAAMLDATTSILPAQLTESTVNHLTPNPLPFQIPFTKPDVQDLFLVFKIKQMSTVLCNNIFLIENRLADMSRPQQFQKKIHIGIEMKIIP
jgi:hypothetical protein